jgi:recombination endonuclease VII
MRYVERRMSELGVANHRTKYAPDAKEKPCSRCGIVKPLDQFSELAHGALGRQARCKSCICLIGKEYTRSHRERKAGRPRPGWCECCGEPATGRRALHWDHDHALDRFRGWLCAQCNQALGQVDDSIKRLELLIAYLQRGGGPRT